MIKKRAQGLPINVMILIILGLIVLFVVIFIFNKGTGEPAHIISSCAGRGGECKDTKEECSAVNGIQIPDAECPQDKPICCKEI